MYTCNIFFFKNSKLVRSYFLVIFHQFLLFKKKNFIVAQCAEIRNESAFLAFTCFMYDMMLKQF